MLHYEITGEGKVNLVLLHGFMESLKVWDDLQKNLDAEFRLIKIDLPGHGLSDTDQETNTMEFMADEVHKITTQLDLDTFHLLGHSMGGYVTLAFAEKYPDLLQSLTLFFSTWMADDAEKKEQRKKSLRIIEQSYSTYVNAGIPNLFNPNEKDILEGKILLAKEIALSTKTEGVTAAVKGMLERPDRLKVLENFEGKILVISGKHDSAVNSVKTISQLPDKTNIKSYLLDCGHNGHWEKPTICAEIINTELLHNLPKHLIF
ncbi:alpha/beta fold hydrolase [Kaistella palustris]|uniref:alpha/beta fold hydrolase n=1 Tax=Kaistella palustris TaxID=493376 RepID=UPI0003FA1688|nr:alpha/beta hydrolase [Kaistella palustris]